MSLLWRIWTRWYELCKTSHEKRDTMKRCFIYIELGHLTRNCMNTRRIEDEKKGKANKIKKQMRQEWVPKSTKNASPRNDDQLTQELGDSIIST